MATCFGQTTLAVFQRAVPTPMGNYDLGSFYRSKKGGKGKDVGSLFCTSDYGDGREKARAVVAR